MSAKISASGPSKRVPNPWLDSLRLARNDECQWQWDFRHSFTHKYSWSAPTQPALDLIKSFSPDGVVEIGAGTGYWASLLRAMGVDVVAVDASPVELGKNRHHRESKSWTRVRRGYATVAGLYPKRTLMLCWPPHNRPMSHLALKHFRGERLIYIGQPRGGLTGTDAFHQALADDWTLVSRKRLLNFREIQDAMYLYRRRNVSAV